MPHNGIRALTGLVTVAVIVAIVAVAVGLFRGSFTETTPVTVLSPRAGLVMNPDAKVKMHGVQVGKVASIESRPNGQAVLHLAMNPSEMHLIPANVLVDLTSPTVFGAKFVELVPPAEPSVQSLHAGQVLDSQHVTVEVNTVFKHLTEVLGTLDPAKLNETLGAIGQALSGRGRKDRSGVQRPRLIPGEVPADPARAEPRHRCLGTGIQRLRRRGARPGENRC